MDVGGEVESFLTGLNKATFDLIKSKDARILELEKALKAADEFHERIWNSATDYVGKADNNLISALLDDCYNYRTARKNES